MPVLYKPQHESFAKLVAGGANYTSAYKIAYNNPKPGTAGSRLYRTDPVRARVKEIRDSPQNLLGAVKALNQKRSWLASVMDNTEVGWKDRIQACRLDAQLAGEFAPTEHRRLELTADLTLDSDEYSKRLAAARQIKRSPRALPKPSPSQDTGMTDARTSPIPDIDLTEAKTGTRPTPEGGRPGETTITSLPTRTGDISNSMAIPGTASTVVDQDLSDSSAGAVIDVASSVVDDSDKGSSMAKAGPDLGGGIDVLDLL